MALEMYRGDTKVFDVTVAVSGTPVNLTGAVLWFTVKAGDAADALALFQKSTGDGIAHANQGTDPGEAAITVDPIDTSAARPGSYLYDLQLVQGSAVTTLEKGVFTLLADVTLSVA